MKGIEANLWTVPAEGETSRLITTNGHTIRAGRCVTGRGCAREARDRFPGLDASSRASSPS